jgi:LacI family transcriptional regulator
MDETLRIVLLFIPSSWYDRGLLEGITSYAQLHGRWMFHLSGDHPELPIPVSDSFSGDLCQQYYLPSKGSNAQLPNFERLKTAGIIGRIQSAEMAKKLLASGLPVIASINLPDKMCEQLCLRSKIPEIVSDSAKIGLLAAEHFLERGFWNYAFCGYQGRSWSDQRLEGFSARLQQAGFVPHVYQLDRIKGSLSWREEMPLVVAWLKTLPRPVALMACDDNRGRQVLDACLSSGLKVPEDVAVVGVDNDHLFGNLSNQPLSSVALNLSKAGYEAAELLDLMMQGKETKPRRIVIEPLWVVPRHSSDLIAVKDPHVAAALRFIVEHAREAIGVNNVVRETGISRRGLEIRFQTILGKSIREEIQRVRLGCAKQLLIESNLSVERIALLTGFCSLSHLGSTFRLANGMTPAQYRRNMCIS